MELVAGLVKLTFRLELAPTCTLPKTKLAGLTFNTAGVTVIVAQADLVGSATDVAVSVTVVLLVTAGAVNNPEELTVPPVVDQVTDWLLALITWAENCWLPLEETLAEVGETTTLTAPDGVVKV